MKTKKDLILITRGFPFGKGESFLENEIFITTQSFNKILIFAQTDHVYAGFDSKEIRHLPKNTEVYRIPTLSQTELKLFQLQSLLSWQLWSEMINLIIKNRFTIYKLKVASNYYIRGKHIFYIVKKYIKHTIAPGSIFYSYWSFEEPLATIWLKKKFKGKAISRAHRGDLYDMAQKEQYLPFRNFIAKNTDGTFSISKDGSKYLQYKSKSKHIFTSRLGTLAIPLPEYKENPKLRILSIGALYSVKRIDLLIKALNSINEFGIIWEHFGTGPDETAIQKLASDLLSKKNVAFFFHGFVNNKDLREHLTENIYDLLINSSSSEGIPVSIMEAMSVGVPCLATDVGGTHEIVDQNNGLLLPADLSPDFLAEKISWFHNLPQGEKIKMRESAYKTWKEKFDAETNYRAFANEIMNIKVQS